MRTIIQPRRDDDASPPTPSTDETPGVEAPGPGTGAETGDATPSPVTEHPSATRRWPAAVGGALLGAALVGGVVAAGHLGGPEPVDTPSVSAPHHPDSGTIGPWQQMGRSVTAEAGRRAVGAAPHGVLLVGDSVGRRTQPALSARLGSSRPLAWDLWNGRPTHGAVDAFLAEHAAGAAPATVLVVSGSNDVFEPEALGPQVERLLAAADADTQVYWVTPWVHRAGSPDADAANTRTMVEALTEAAGRHPNLHLVPWSEHLAGLDVARQKELVPDGVHPSPAGIQHLADLIVRSLTGAGA